MDLKTLLSKSEKKLVGLHPKVAYYAQKVIEQAFSEGILVQITQGLRTIAEQQALYDQGRTKPGNIVTNAKPGTSYHNYGLAVDYVLLSDDGKTALWTVNTKWKRVAAIGKSYGFAWGGDWTSFKDYPHLEMSFGLTCTQLKAGKKPPTWTPPVEEKKPEAPKDEPKCEEEGEDNMPMKLANWAWDMIEAYLCHAYDDKVISDIAWVEKARKKTLTASEHSYVTMVIEAKRRGGEGELIK